MHTLTYILLRLILGFFAILPLPLASSIGGKLGQFIGPKTRRHKIAQKNLDLIYPNKDLAWRQQVLSGMWSHLGRLLAEMPALKSGELLLHVNKVDGAEHLLADQQAIYVSAHFGQWELLAPMARTNGVERLASVYRHINNSKIDELLKSCRAPFNGDLIRKKGDNAIALVRALKDGKSLAILTDQRLTKGPRIKFLGIEAGSNIVACKLAVKMGLPVIVGFVTREQGVEFNATLSPPIHPPEQGSDEEKTSAMAEAMFKLIEQQIHQRPEQYMWTHDRWK